MDKNVQEPATSKETQDCDGDYLFPVEIKGKDGYINCAGNIIIAPQFDIALNFHEGLAAVSVGDKWGFIDRTGKIVIAPRFRNVGEFSEGLAFAAETGSPNYGVIDKRGKFVIEPLFATGSDFSEGLAMVDIHWGGRHYIDRKGETALVLSDGYSPGDNFHDGLALVRKNDKYGFIDKKGEVVIAPQYDDAGGFSEGLAPVQINDKSMYIDKTGKQAISQNYDFTSGFSEGLAAVKIDDVWGYGEWGYIDKTGNFVIPPQFKAAGSFRGGLAGVEGFDGGVGFHVRSPWVGVSSTDRENIALSLFYRNRK
jgi:WG repeat protein